MENSSTYKSWCCLNGEFFDPGKPLLMLQNRGFSYGDALFETIHAFGTEPRHFHLHFRRLMAGMETLGMRVPPYFDQEQLFGLIVKLLNKARIFRSAKIRLTVFRNDGGLYTPATNEVSFTIEATPLEQQKYTLNEKGLFIDIYTETTKPQNMFSPYKTANALLFVMASRFKQSKGLGDCVILNSEGKIVEATSSNIFLIKGNNLYTPRLSDGCIAGVMRQKVIELAPKVGLVVNDNVSLVEANLLASDEIFLTNAVTGLRWAMGFRDRRYFCSYAKKINLLLNRETFGD